MSNSLAKLEWANTTRLLYFKHRGNLAKVVADLRARYENEVDNVNARLTVDFVEKVIKKFKREEKVNSPYVATWILEYILMGTKQREVLWDIDDQELEEYKFSYRSACCDAATVSRVDDKEAEHFLCLKCEKICNVYRVPNLEVFNLKKQIRAEKRKDEVQLVKAADNLGFGGEKAPVIKETNYQVVLTGGSKRKQIASLPKEDRDFVTDFKQMNPMDQEVVIGRVRQRLNELDE